MFLGEVYPSIPERRCGPCNWVALLRMRMLDVLRDMAETSERLASRGDRFSERQIVRMTLATMIRADLIDYLTSLQEPPTPSADPSLHPAMALIRMGQLVHSNVALQSVLIACPEPLFPPLPQEAEGIWETRYLYADAPRAAGEAPDHDVAQIDPRSQFIGVYHHDPAVLESAAAILLRDARYDGSARLVLGPWSTLKGIQTTWRESERLIFGGPLMHGSPNPLGGIYLSRTTTRDELLSHTPVSAGGRLARG